MTGWLIILIASIVLFFVGIFMEFDGLAQLCAIVFLVAIITIISNFNSSRVQIEKFKSHKEYYENLSNPATSDVLQMKEDNKWLLNAKSNVKAYGTFSFLQEAKNLEFIKLPDETVNSDGKTIIKVEK